MSLLFSNFLHIISSYTILVTHLFFPKRHISPIIHLQLLNNIHCSPCSKIWSCDASTQILLHPNWSALSPPTGQECSLLGALCLIIWNAVLLILGHMLCSYSPRFHLKILSHWAPQFWGTALLSEILWFFSIVLSYINVHLLWKQLEGMGRMGIIFVIQ